VHQLANDLPNRLVIAHLDNGASVTAVKGGKSIDTNGIDANRRGDYGHAKRIVGARRADVTGFGVPEHHGDGSALPMPVQCGNLRKSPGSRK